MGLLILEFLLVLIGLGAFGLLPLLCSLNALLNAVFRRAIVCSASAWIEPPLISLCTIRLCSTRLAGTLYSARVGAGFVFESNTGSNTLVQLSVLGFQLTFAALDSILTPAHH